MALHVPNIKKLRRLASLRSVLEKNNRNSVAGRLGENHAVTRLDAHP